MSNTRNHKKRSNSLHLNKIPIILNQESKESEDDLLSKSTLFKKKEMISFKNIQNFDLTTYDYIFIGSQFSDNTIQDFKSFTNYLNNIKNKYISAISKKNNNIESIKNDGKFSFNNSNITNLISFSHKKNKNIEISINNRFLKSYNLSDKLINFYGTKTFFKGKHCFEIEILNMMNPQLALGIMNISYFELFQKNFERTSLLNLNVLTQIYKENINMFFINEPIFIQNNNNEIYNHYITYGDIFGCCYDLEKKLMYLFLNGEIINTYVLNVDIVQNSSFVPVISIGNNTEIIFNPGPTLKYEKKYNNFGFIPLDENGKNYYEISQLKNVTDEFLDILIKKGKKIINNKNISYSDINQIYHIIFDFLGNVSFRHSYIVQNSFIKPFANKNSIKNEDLELYYICLKYILNSTKDKKLIIKNIFLNLAEAIHINLRKGSFENAYIFQNLIKLLTFIFQKKEIMNILSKIPKTLKKY